MKGYELKTSRDPIAEESIFYIKTMQHACLSWHEVSYTIWFSNY